MIFSLPELHWNKQERDYITPSEDYVCTALEILDSGSLSVCLSIYLSVCLSVHLPVSLFVCPSICHKLQYRLCTKIASSEVGDLLAHVPSERDAARLRSLQENGAGSWLEVIPSSGKHALKANKFSIASYLRMGLPLPFTEWANVCDCGRVIDPQGYHFWSVSMEVVLFGPTTLFSMTGVNA